MEVTNKDIYQYYENTIWANKSNESLIYAEDYLLSKYLLNKSGNILEVGTGGGRIVFNIERKGFKNITAIDFVPLMIEAAKNYAGKIGSNINFLTGDAVDLALFPNSSFNYIIYLQQIICFIPLGLIDKALAESYRITKQGGIGIFSFLFWNGRIINIPLSLLTNFLRLLRGQPVNKKYLPWLLLGNKFNWNFLGRNQACNYWFEKEEIIAKLIKCGYSVIEAMTASEIAGSGNKNRGMLYLVVQKS